MRKIFIFTILILITLSSLCFAKEKFPVITGYDEFEPSHHWQGVSFTYNPPYHMLSLDDDMDKVDVTFNIHYKNKDITSRNLVITLHSDDTLQYIQKEINIISGNMASKITSPDAHIEVSLGGIRKWDSMIVIDITDESIYKLFMSGDKIKLRFRCETPYGVKEKVFEMPAEFTTQVKSIYTLDKPS